MGESWCDVNDRAVEVPALYEQRIGVPPLYPYDGDWRIGGLSLDSHGLPWALTFSPQLDWPELWLTRWRDGQGTSVDIAPYLAAGWQGVDATMTIDSRDHIHVVVTAVPAGSVGSDKAWGHPHSEVFHMMSADSGLTFVCRQLSPTDETTPNWLPNISLGGVFAPVENPVILYTHGVAGAGCSPPTTTEAYCILTEDAT
jgi:hypothetical protein